MGIAEVILNVTDRASSELRKVADEGKKTDKVTTKLTAGMLGLGAGLVAAGGAAIAFIQKLSDMQNDISDMSARTGVATDTLSALRIMAEATGRQFEDLNEVINPLVARMGQVAAGNEAVGKQFAALGIEVVDAQGDMRSTDMGLRDIMSTLTDIEDPTHRAAAAVSLLGESGGKLVQVLGAGEFEAFDAFASNFGLQTGPAAAKAAADWQVSIALLKTTVEGFAGSLSEIAGPSIQKFLDNFTLGFVTTVTFIKTLIEELGAGIAQVFGNLTDNLKDFFDKLSPGRLIKAVVTGGLSELFEETSLQGDALRLLGTTEGDIASALSGAFAAARDEAFAVGQRFFETRAAVQAAGPSVAPALGPTGAAAPGEGLKKADKAATDFAAVMNEGLGLLGDFNDEADKAARALAEAEKAARELALAQTQQVVGMAQQALTGDVSGLIGSVGAAAGPAGMVAAQIVQGIEAIGQLGAKGVEEKLEEFQSNLLAGIKALPEIIGKVLPEFISELVPALVTGLVEALPELLIAQVEAFARLILAGFRDIPMAIAEGLTTAFLSIWDRVKEFFKDLFSLRLGKAFGGGEDGKGGLGRTLGKVARVGAAISTLGASELAIAVGKGVKNAVEGRSFARGGVVDRTGLAMVHAGERFTRQDGSMSGTTRAAMGAGGGGVVINLQGIMTKRDLIEQIRRELGTRGSGLTLDPFTS